MIFNFPKMDIHDGQTKSIVPLLAIVHSQILQFTIVKCILNFIVVQGLIEAIAQKVPHAVHRKCCMHIFTNFRAKFPPLLIRNYFGRLLGPTLRKGIREQW